MYVSARTSSVSPTQPSLDMYVCKRNYFHLRFIQYLPPTKIAAKGLLTHSRNAFLSFSAVICLFYTFSVVAYSQVFVS